MTLASVVTSSPATIAIIDPGSERVEQDAEGEGDGGLGARPATSTSRHAT